MGIQRHKPGLALYVFEAFKATDQIRSMPVRFPVHREKYLITHMIPDRTRLSKMHVVTGK